MNLWRRDFLLLVTLAGAAATPAWGQLAAPSVRPAGGAASIPDFSGIWAHPGLGFENPLSGPGPVRNKSRLPSGASNFNRLVGDYSNPILKPHAAEIVKKFGEISRSGLAFPDPDSQCLIQPVPYIFWNFEIQILQQPDKVTIIYPHDQDYRQIRLNQPHPAKVVPTAHGDSVGHYEGDTLVIDTVGIKVGPFAMVDMYGTPHSPALHVVERYRLVDYDDAKDALERNAKENSYIAATAATGVVEVDTNHRGKMLQLHFTVEDPGVFTMPWTGTITYRPNLGPWTEVICAENIQWYSGKDSAVPQADKPDF